MPRFCQQLRVLSAVPRVCQQRHLSVASATSVGNATCLLTVSRVCQQCLVVSAVPRDVSSATCLSTVPHVCQQHHVLSAVSCVSRQCHMSVNSATSLSAVPRVCQQCHVSDNTSTNLSTVCINATCLLTAQRVVNTAMEMSPVSHIC